MAAIDLPWNQYMSRAEHSASSNSLGINHGRATSITNAPSPGLKDVNLPTVAPFASSPSSSRASYQQVFQKSPLLASTPPQITRALSQSYPFIRALNDVLGLVTWTTDDPWKSFLVVAVFWALALYGDTMLMWGGNVLVVALVAGWSFLKSRQKEEIHPSLDQIIETMTLFTARCNLLLSPLTLVVNALSTGTTPTTASTAPAITTLFIRILFVSPIWLTFAVGPFQIITARRIILFAGTAALSWHSKPARVSRAILWRSATLRSICEHVTGLDLSPPPTAPALPPRRRSSMAAPVKEANGVKKIVHHRSPSMTAATKELEIKSSPLANPASSKGSSPGVRFTFVIYENQRRWIGVGWTSSLFAYERAAWTDEHLTPCPSVEEFTLPEAKDGMRWRWVPGDEWRVEGEEDVKSESKSHKQEVKQDLKDKLGGKGEEGKGWIYYDNKWRDGKRGVDGWGKYTRRRKWFRNAELIEDVTAVSSPTEESFEKKELKHTMTETEAT